MARIKKLSVFSFAIFQAFLFGLLGILCGIMYSFGGLIYDIVTTGSVNYGTALAFLALLGMPLIFMVVGFAAGLVEAITYNLLTSKFSGLTLNFKSLD